MAVTILMVGTLTAAANLWGVKRINHRILSRIGPQGSDLLGREVCMFLRSRFSLRLVDDKHDARLAEVFVPAERSG